MNIFCTKCVKIVKFYNLERNEEKIQILQFIWIEVSNYHQSL